MPLLRLFLILIMFNMFSSFVYADDKTPDKIVKQTVDAVFSVLRNTDLNEEEKKNRVFKLAEERINFKDMSRRVLATNWNVASEEQKTEFIALFKQILLNSYWVRIKHYAGEHVEYISVVYDKEDYATVDTIILKFKDDIEIPISYRMKRFVDIWYAYDFTVERLSLVQSYRNEYRAIIKNFGINGLLEQMRKEIDTYTSN